MNIVVTGRLNHFHSRAEMESEIIHLQNGRPLQKQVDATTDILVTNTPDSGTKKNRDARKYGTLIWDEETFCEHAHIPYTK